jgi:hypothetical protein
MRTIRQGAFWWGVVAGAVIIYFVLPMFSGALTPGRGDGSYGTNGGS